jgi:glycosyltransferase involved in cell wall biosynthesis
VRRGCFPLPPARPSYAELIPEAYHEEVLYASPEELADKLVRLLAELPQPDSPRRKSVRSLAAAMNRFAWDNLIEEYDAELERLPRYGTRATTSLS